MYSGRRRRGEEMKWEVDEELKELTAIRVDPSQEVWREPRSVLPRRKKKNKKNRRPTDRGNLSFLRFSLRPSIIIIISFQCCSAILREIERCWSPRSAREAETLARAFFCACTCVRVSSCVSRALRSQAGMKTVRRGRRRRRACAVGAPSAAAHTFRASWTKGLYYNVKCEHANK